MLFKPTNYSIMIWDDGYLILGHFVLNENGSVCPNRHYDLSFGVSESKICYIEGIRYNG